MAKRMHFKILKGLRRFMFQARPSGKLFRKKTIFNNETATRHKFLGIKINP